MEIVRKHCSVIKLFCDIALQSDRVRENWIWLMSILKFVGCEQSQKSH